MSTLSNQFKDKKSWK